jgi:hypothetical protein
MGKSLNQILTEAADGNEIGVTIATNQDDGPNGPIVGYATGRLIYQAARPGFPEHPFPFPGRLANAPNAPLTFYFSDRVSIIDRPEGGLGGIQQPFRADATDHLGLSLSISVSLPHTASFTFIDWGGGVFNFLLEDRENLLIGTGPSLGISEDALYVLSFTGPFPPIQPPH